jgi:ATP-dependent protease ClpP protease subunit
VTAEIKERTTPCFRVVNADSERPKLYVYDVIGGWDLDAEEFVRAVHSIDAPVLDLHINSPGGFVFDAVSMFEALQASPTKVAVSVDGLAASAASFLAQAGDTIKTAKASRWMIHDAQGIAMGSPADMREFADTLDEISNDIAGYYADRAGGKPEAWRAAMQATTWYSGQQAVDAKLADSITSNESNAGPDNRTRLIQARHRAALATQGG